MIEAIAAYIHKGIKPVDTKVFEVDGVEWEMKVFVGKDVKTIDEKLEKLIKAQELASALGV